MYFFLNNAVTKKLERIGGRLTDQVRTQKRDLITFFFHEEKVKEKQNGTLGLY